MAGTIYNIVGADTFTIFDRVLNDFADGDSSTITFNNDLVGVKTGKNGNTIYALNETGNNAVAQLRIMLGSSDDVFLQSKIPVSGKNFPSTILANGQFVKNLGDGEGNVSRDVYSLAGGIITRLVDGKTNVEGDTQQGVSVYNITFASAKRSFQ